MAGQSIAAGGARETRAGIRAWYTAFIARHNLAWELGFGALAVLFVAIGFADNVTTDERALSAVDVLEWTLTVIFFVEFTTRLLAAEPPASYLRRHWPDALALLPAIRGIRMLRLLRVLRFARLFSGVYRASSKYGGLSDHRDFVGLMISWVGLGVICTIALFSAELDDPNKSIKTPFDAIWWGVGALTTVGSDLFPVTLEGKLAAIALMIVGAFLFAAVTATMTSFLVRPAEQNDCPECTEFERLAKLHRRGAATHEEYERARTHALVGHAAPEPSAAPSPVREAGFARPDGIGHTRPAGRASLLPPRRRGISPGAEVGIISGLVLAGIAGYAARGRRRGAGASSWVRR